MEMFNNITACADIDFLNDLEASLPLPAAAADVVSETVTLDALDLPDLPEGDAEASAEAAEAEDWDPLAEGYISELGLARGLAVTGWNKSARYVHELKKWVFFDDATGWRLDHANTAIHHVGDFLKNVADQIIARASGDDRAMKAALSSAKSMLSLSTISAIERLCQRNPGLIAEQKMLDADALLLGTPDGVIDLKTGELRPFAREEKVTLRTGFSPAPAGAVPERWLQFLSETLGGDQDRIDMVRREAGYAMTGIGKERALFYHQGSGGDGKSTLLYVLQNILGEYQQTAHVDTFLQKPAGFTGHPTDLAKLRGARLIVAPEAPSNATWNESVIKRFTGGDTVTARLVHANFGDFESSAALVVTGNSLPTFSTMDNGIRDRFILIRHPTKFADTASEDRGLREYLIEHEGPEILRWCIDAAREYLEIGLAVPASIRAESAVYLDGEDKVGLWLEQHVEFVDGSYEMTADLFASFRPWIEAQGVKDWTQNRFTKEMNKRNLKDHRTSAGRGFKGIRLLSEAEASDRKEIAKARARGEAVGLDGTGTSF